MTLKNILKTWKGVSDMGGKVYAVYEDDGPLGICGQGMSITRRFKKLHIFDSYDNFIKWAGVVPLVKTRVNPRITGWWDATDDGRDSEDVIFHTEENR